MRLFCSTFPNGILLLFSVIEAFLRRAPKSSVSGGSDKLFDWDLFPKNQLLFQKPDGQRNSIIAPIILSNKNNWSDSKTLFQLTGPQKYLQKFPVSFKMSKMFWKKTSSKSHHNAQLFWVLRYWIRINKNDKGGISLDSLLNALIP